MSPEDEASLLRRTGVCYALTLRGHGRHRPAIHPFSSRDARFAERQLGIPLAECR